MRKERTGESTKRKDGDGAPSPQPPLHPPFPIFFFFFRIFYSSSGRIIYDEKEIYHRIFVRTSFLFFFNSPPPRTHFYVICIICFSNISYIIIYAATDAEDFFF